MNLPPKGSTISQEYKYGDPALNTWIWGQITQNHNKDLLLLSLLSNYYVAGTFLSIYMYTLLNCQSIVKSIMIFSITFYAIEK